VSKTLLSLALVVALTGSIAATRSLANEAAPPAVSGDTAAVQLVQTVPPEGDPAPTTETVPQATVVVTGADDAKTAVAEAKVAQAAVDQVRAAKAETQLAELARLRDLNAAQMVLRKLELRQQLNTATISAVEKLLIQEQIDTISRCIPIRMQGVELTATQLADIRVRHEWAYEAFRQGKAPAELPPENTEWTVYGLYVFATQGEAINPVLYRALVDALASIGIELETPVMPGSGWLGYDAGGKSAY